MVHSPSFSDTVILKVRCGEHQELSYHHVPRFSLILKLIHQQLIARPMFRIKGISAILTLLASY